MVQALNSGRFQRIASGSGPSNQLVGATRAPGNQGGQANQGRGAKRNSVSPADEVRFFY